MSYKTKKKLLNLNINYLKRKMYYDDKLCRLHNLVDDF